MYNAAEAFPQNSMWVRDERLAKMGVMGQHSDNLSARACWLLSPFLPYFCLCKGYTSHLI